MARAAGGRPSEATATLATILTRRVSRAKTMDRGGALRHRPPHRTPHRPHRHRHHRGQSSLAPNHGVHHGVLHGVHGDRRSPPRPSAAVQSAPTEDRGRTLAACAGRGSRLPPPRAASLGQARIRGKGAKGVFDALRRRPLYPCPSLSQAKLKQAPVGSPSARRAQQPGLPTQPGVKAGPLRGVRCARLISPALPRPKDHDSTASAAQPACPAPSPVEHC